MPIHATAQLPLHAVHMGPHAPRFHIHCACWLLSIRPANSNGGPLGSGLKASTWRPGNSASRYVCKVTCLFCYVPASVLQISRAELLSMRGVSFWCTRHAAWCASIAGLARATEERTLASYTRNCAALETSGWAWLRRMMLHQTHRQSLVLGRNGSEAGDLSTTTAGSRRRRRRRRRKQGLYSSSWTHRGQLHVPAQH